MDKNLRSHNWVLLTNDADVAEFRALASTAKATDYIPAGTFKVIAHTKLLSGGESEKIEFQAPLDLRFYLQLPGTLRSYERKVFC